jgi:hypothetical protein
MALYESTRTVFNVIVKQYKAYLQLYAQFNGGSIEGAIPFDRFYWQYTYITKYSDRELIPGRGP